VLVALLILLYVRFARRRRMVVLQPAAATPPPDLASDAVLANELPESGWAALAQEYLAKGELRLALRALYLASLAHLAQRDLISIRASKSNWDYRLELERRGRGLPVLIAAFRENVLVFDRAWYGRYAVSPEIVQAFTANLERIGRAE
jgi:hypothetical protein